MKERVIQLSEKYLLVTLGLFSLGVFWRSFELFNLDRSLSSPGFIPLITSIVLIVVITSLIVKSLTSKDRTEKKESIMNKDVIVIIVSFVLFIILEKYIGFYPSSLIFIICSIGFLNRGKYLESLKYSVLFILFIWIVFGSVFRVIIK